jgi:hypothetical protein
MAGCTFTSVNSVRPHLWDPKETGISPIKTSMNINNLLCLAKGFGDAFASIGPKLQT